MAGKQPEYNKQEVMNTVCERIANGESLRAICKHKDMPNRKTINEWVNDESNSKLSSQYARAREEQADNIFEELTELIINTPADPNEIAKTRILIDTKKWQLARMNSTKYGDKILQDVSIKEFDRVVNIL